MKKNIRIAKKLIYLAKIMIAEDKSKQIDDQIKKEISYDDCLRDPEGSLDKMSEIINDEEFDKLVKDIKAGGRRMHTMVASKQEKCFGKELSPQDKKVALEQGFNSSCFSISGESIRVEYPLRKSNNVFEFPLAEYVEFLEDTPVINDEELEDICYNLIDAEKEKVREKLTKELEQNQELCEKLFNNKDAIIEKIKKKHSGLWEKLKKVAEFANKHALKTAAIVSCILAALAVCHVGSDEVKYIKLILGDAGFTMTIANLVIHLTNKLKK